MDRANIRVEDLLDNLERLERLIEEHRLLKEAIEFCPMPFCVYDHDDCLIAWNQDYADLQPGLAGVALHDTDRPPLRYAALLRQQLAGQVAPEDLEQAVAERVFSLRSSDSSAVEQYYGQYGWMRVVKYVTPSGAVAGLSLDATELKQREDELRAAEVRAVAADRAKAEFLANMSHEIRTPMNGVLGMAELLAQTSLDDRQRMFNDVIVKSGHALLAIINDILDFSKIEAGQMSIDPAPFDLTGEVDDVMCLFTGSIAAKGLDLSVRVDPALPPSLIGDAGRLRQILTNLVSNAIKFTDEGYVYVNVDAEVASGANGEPACAVTVTVEDTGCGVPADKREVIFHKFTQVDSSSRRKHEGTGLGLCIAAALVEQMGGEIGVRCGDDRGSAFWFQVTLPVDRSAPAQAPERPDDVSGKRALVIDDNAVNRTILLEQLAAWGLEAEASASGAQGLERLLSAAVAMAPFDLLIVDYQMPGMSGEDVLRSVRSLPSLRDLPVVLLTSVDCSEAGSALAGLGLTAHVIKPARGSTLQDAVEQALQRGAMTAAQTHPPAGPDASQGAAAPPPPAVSCAEPPGAPDSGLDVLVAEDNDIGQMVMRQILTKAGVRFRMVENGQEAVAAYRQQVPDVILMDVSMPLMNGLDAARAIRAIERGGHIHTPIIGLTAHALDGDRETCLEAGMDDYLSKPISPKDVAARLRRWSDMQGARVDR